MRNSRAMEETLRSMVYRNPRNTLILWSFSNDQDPAALSKDQTLNIEKFLKVWPVGMPVHLMFTDVHA